MKRKRKKAKRKKKETVVERAMRLHENGIKQLRKDIIYIRKEAEARVKHIQKRIRNRCFMLKALQRGELRP